MRDRQGVIDRDTDRVTEKRKGINIVRDRIQKDRKRKEKQIRIKDIQRNRQRHTEIETEIE